MNSNEMKQEILTYINSLDAEDYLSIRILRHVYHYVKNIKAIYSR